MAWQSSILFNGRQGATEWECNRCVKWRQSVPVRHRLRAIAWEHRVERKRQHRYWRAMTDLASNHSSKRFGYIDIKTAYRAHNKTEQLNQPHMVCPANSHMGSSAICASGFLWTPPLAKWAWTHALPVREEWCSPDRDCRTKLSGCGPRIHLYLVFHALSAHLSPCTCCSKLIEETAVWAF